MIEGASLIKQGAEARVYHVPFLSLPLGAVAKHRFAKTYRHPDLDKKLTARRVIQEARCLHKCRRSKIDTPAVYFVDVEGAIIYMEMVEGEMVKDLLGRVGGDVSAKEIESIMRAIGTSLARMHDADVIHGDLTTSNLMVRSFNRSLVVIDFGLAYVSSLPEDKAVDLYVLERAFSSTHPNSEAFFGLVLDAYVAGAAKPKEVMGRLEDVRLRGRKRTMVG